MAQQIFTYKGKYENMASSNNKTAQYLDIPTYSIILFEFTAKYFADKILFRFNITLIIIIIYSHCSHNFIVVIGK